jgi:nitroreductase/NAD-dependent dihydropyrimidine dehydrogenase PreA subunit
MTNGQAHFVFVDDTRCSRCRSCRAVCPNQVFSWEENVLVTAFAGRCIDCGHCVAVCPTGAFHHSRLGPDRFEDIAPTYPISTEVLQSAFERRRSVRRFSAAPVTPEELGMLLDAGGAAPTATNSRNVRFIALETAAQLQMLENRTAEYYLKLERQLRNPVVRFFISLAVGKKTVDAYKYHLPIIAAHFRESKEGTRRIFYGAPLVLVAFASGLPHIAAANCNLAVMQMMLRAESMGLGSCYNGYALTALVRDRRLREALHIPKGSTPAAVIALGRPTVTYSRRPKRRRPRVMD